MKYIHIILFTISFPVAAETYYIKNSGNDGNTGTSNAQAWQTFDNINSGTFSAGDSILFNRGDLWREEVDGTDAGYDGMISFSESGTLANRIFIGAYGTGTRPKLYGSLALNSFESLGNNIYRGSREIYRDPYNLPCWGGGTYDAAIFFCINDTVLRADTSVTIANMDADMEWDWQNDSIYFYWSGDINDIDSIEVVQRNSIFELTGEGYHIDSLELMYFLTNSMGSSVFPEVTHYGMTVSNCVLAHSGTRDGIGYGLDLHFSNMLIEYNWAYDNGRRNFSFNITNTGGSCIMRNVIIQNNRCDWGYHTTGIDMATHGVNHEAKNIIVRNNIVHTDMNESDNRYGRTPIWFYQDGTADDYDMDSIFIYNNDIQNCPSAGLALWNVGRIFICNNSFSAFPNYVTGAYAFIGFVAATAVNATIMNNSFYVYNSQARFYMCIRGYDADRSAVTWDTVDYNYVYIENDANQYIIDPPSEWAQGSYNASEQEEIQGYGWEVNSPAWQNPICLVDSLETGEVKGSSPLVRAGKHISFVTTDINGVSRGDTPDIGAYQVSAATSNGTIDFIKHNSKFVKHNGKFIVR